MSFCALTERNKALSPLKAHRGTHMGVNVTKSRNGKTGSGILVPNSAGERKSDLSVLDRRRKRMFLWVFILCSALTYGFGVLVERERSACDRIFPSISNNQVNNLLEFQFYQRHGLGSSYVEYSRLGFKRKSMFTIDEYLQTRTRLMSRLDR